MSYDIDYLFTHMRNVIPNPYIYNYVCVCATDVEMSCTLQNAYRYMSHFLVDDTVINVRSKGDY